MNAPLVVFSHLRWNFVFQRPQHLLSRLAEDRPVYLIEEPLPSGDQAAHWQFEAVDPNVTVCRPHTPLEGAPGFCNAQLPHLQPLVAELLAQLKLEQYVLWFYTPMAWPLGARLAPQAVVYDCMDELSCFKNAPPEMLAREADLLAAADVVFTGGRSLYRAKKDRHPHVRCFPSSVDAEHFGQAARPLPEPEDQRRLHHPRLGYFGVIDERLDLPLLDALAQADPAWQIVMVGPVVKIDPASLPRHPNLHYLGQKEYRELPRYLSGWDVCLLPFARNEATQFISPTKTLEYMAAQKLIVSTPITDVAEPYAKQVYLADTPDEFIAACRAVLTADPQERAIRLAGMADVLRKTSWDQTAARMASEIDEAIARRAALAAASEQETPPVIVIGAGPTGLSAAYHLGEQALLLEKRDAPGGLCRSIYQDGFTFDLAGHIMFSKDPYVHEMYEMLLGDNVHWQDREAWIYSKEVYTRYPFQGCLYGLPAEVITECILGAIEARFGPIKEQAQAEDAVSQAAARGHNGPPKAAHSSGNGASRASNGCAPTKKLEDCCGDGILEAETKLAAAQPSAAHANVKAPPANFEEFIYQVWGRGIAKHFAIPYNRKLWAVPLEEMETSWLGGRVPMPDLEEMIQYALTPASKPMGPNARFGYPLRGGFQALMEGFLPHLGERLQLNTGVVSVSPARRTVTTSDGRELPYQVLISTMPLPLLIRAMGDEAPASIQAAAKRLRYVSVRCVHLGVGRENLTEKHWIYYPEETVFHRIFVQGNASPHCNPSGGFGLTCEITYSANKPLPCDGDALVARCVADCRQVGLIAAEDPIWTALQVDMPFAYVVYDHQRKETVRQIRRWLAEQDILLSGRYSEWEYYNSDHAFIAGKHAAESARERLQTPAVNLV